MVHLLQHHVSHCGQLVAQEGKEDIEVEALVSAASSPCIQRLAAPRYKGFLQSAWALMDLST